MIRVVGDGAPVVGIVGKIVAPKTTALGLLYKGQEAWDPMALGPVQVAVAKDTPEIIAGTHMRDRQFKDVSPEGGVLIGLEIGLGKYFGDDVTQAVRPIYRVGNDERFGAQRGEPRERTVTLKAKAGYAVGAIHYRFGLNFDGCSLIFMKVADGRLDPNDSYESDWAGYIGKKRFYKLTGDGRPVVGIAGRAGAKDLHGLGLLFKGQEEWNPGEVILGQNNDPTFREEAPAGGMLVGFNVHLGTFSNYDVIDAIQPIYRAAGKETLGEFHGRDTKREVHVVAKPGYAVGALTVRAGAGVDSFIVTFMKVNGQRLDPNDSYDSEKIGGPGGDNHPKLGGDGTPVTGIVGRKNSVKLSGLGLTFATKK